MHFGNVYGLSSLFQALSQWGECKRSEKEGDSPISPYFFFTRFSRTRTTDWEPGTGYGLSKFYNQKY